MDHSHRSVIIRAYENSYINPEHRDDVFAVNVLKTLFMIKYVREIEANVENITSLMIESMDDDRLALKGRVEEALKVLMRQMLVQKNGSVHVFLTNEEQEINNEIEKENVEMPEVNHQDRRDDFRRYPPRKEVPLSCVQWAVFLRVQSGGGRPPL